MKKKILPFAIIISNLVDSLWNNLSDHKLKFKD